MPMVIPAIVAWAAGATFTAGFAMTAVFIATYGAAIITGALIVGTLAYSASQKRKAERNARSAYNAAQVDRLANVSVTTAPRELVMGRVRKGGNVFFKGSTGAEKEKFVMLIGLAGHEIDGVEQIYLNDQPVTLDAGGYVQDAPYLIVSTASGSASSIVSPPAAPANAIPSSIHTSQVFGGGDGDYFHSWTTTWQYYVYTPKVRIRAVLGTPWQSADATMVALFPGLWTASHRAQGVAYLIVECDYNETAFPSGLPNVTAVIRGAKVYDPRSGLTQWTENPALLARHVLMHPQFGKRTALTSTETARIVAAANACATWHNYGAGYVALYRAAVVLPFGTTARDALDDLTQAMGGSWAYAAGEFYIRAGVYSAPVLSLSDSDLAVVTSGDGAIQQPISISPHRSRNEKINVVTPRIWDAAQGYKRAALIPIKAASLIARDGAELVQEVDMQAVFDARQALHIAGVLMRDARDPLTVTLPFKLSAYRAEMFDTISLSLARFGWSSKLFTVMSRTWSHDGKIMLSLKETAAAIYQPDTAFVVGGYADNTALPRPWEIYPPAIAAISSGTEELLKQADGTIIVRVRVQWAPINDQSITQGGNVEVQWQLAGEQGWTSVMLEGDQTQAWLNDVPDGQTIIVRVRVRNKVAVSDWGLQKPHFVVGKTAPPGDVQEFTIAGDTLSWSPVADIDLAGYVLRFQYGASSDWGSATALHTGVITENPWELVARPSGLATIMIKAVDTSGNFSNKAAAVIQDLGDAPIANVVEVIDVDAMGYPGSVTGGSRIGGDLLADNTNGFYGPGPQSFYGEGSDSFYKLTSYGTMVYVSSYIAINSALAGSIGTLLVDYEGVDFKVEYRMAGQQPFYGMGSAPFYGVGHDPFYGSPGAWQAWPGQLQLDNDVYQFRLTVGSGSLRGKINSFSIIVDAPDIIEYVNDLPVSSAGTLIPYLKPFTAIKNIQITLQSNLSGAETVEIDKSAPMAPKVRAFNSAHAAVSGATIDVIMKGY